MLKFTVSEPDVLSRVAWKPPLEPPSVASPSAATVTTVGTVRSSKHSSIGRKRLGLRGVDDFDVLTGGATIQTEDAAKETREAARRHGRAFRVVAFNVPR